MNVLRCFSIINLFILLFPLAKCYGQSKAIEPTYIGEALYVDDTQMRILSVERRKVRKRKKANAEFWLLGNTRKSIIYVRDSTSSVEIPQSDSTRFIIKVPEAEVDPQNQILIFRLNQSHKGDYRYISTDWSGDVDPEKMDVVDYVAEPYGEKSYLVTIRHRIPKGEYAIKVKNDYYHFSLFRVR